MDAQFIAAPVAEPPRCDYPDCLTWLKALYAWRRENAVDYEVENVASGTHNAGNFFERVHRFDRQNRLGE